MSLTFYFCVYAVLIALAILSPRGRRVNLGLLIVLLIVLLIPAWRLEGVDRDVYLSSMDGTAAIPVAEVSFYHICWVASLFCSDERLLFLIYALISVGGTLFFLWFLNRRLWWCVLIYYSHFYIVHGMIQIRCANSVLFFLIFVTLWNTKISGIGASRTFQRKLSALCAFAGSVYWHLSGCLGVIALFLRGKRFSSALYLSMIVVALVAYASGFTVSSLLGMVHLSFVQEGFDKYNASMAAGQNLDYRALGLWRTVKLVLAVVCLAVSARIVRFSRTSAFLKIWVVSLCIGLLFVDFPALACRATEYMESVEYILIPTVAFAICGRVGVIPVIFYCLGSSFCDLIRTGLIPL